MKPEDICGTLVGHNLENRRRPIQVKQKGEKSKQGSNTNQPQRLASRNLHGEEDLMVRHIQNDLVLRNQDVTAAVSVRTEGGVGLA